MATGNDVRSALRVLRAGVPGEHPAIDDDTVELWDQTLSVVSGKAITEAALRWVEEQPKFPNLHQFLAYAQETARIMAIRQRELEKPVGWIGDAQGLAVCAECGGTDHVEVEDPDHPGNLYVRPCSECDPERYERWRGGHFDPEHDRRNCSHELCQRAGGGGRRKAS